MLPTRITRRGPPQLEPRLRHGREHRVEHVVGGALLGERLVGQHEPVSERVLRERADVGGDHVVAAVDERQRPGALDERDRPAGLAPYATSSVDLPSPNCRGLPRRGGEADGVADEAGVDVDAP